MTAFAAVLLLALPVAARGQNPPSAAAPLVGRWSGTVRQSNPDETYPVTMELRGSVGGTIDYPSLKCGGTLAFLEADARGFWYREHIAYGTDHCAEGGSLQVMPTGTGLQWVWSGSGIMAIGILSTAP